MRKRPVTSSTRSVAASVKPRTCPQPAPPGIGRSRADRNASRNPVRSSSQLAMSLSKGLLLRDLGLESLELDADLGVGVAGQLNGQAIQPPGGHLIDPRPVELEVGRVTGAEERLVIGGQVDR